MTARFRKIFPFLAILTVLSLIIGGVAIAEEKHFMDDTDGSWRVDDGTPIVVELFTATNCSACMPADRILYDISKEKNVIALGCHINYWDEHTLGDPTGLEECTYRQWAYRSSGMLAGTNVKVPHFMINGIYSVDNSHTRLFYSRLQQAKRSKIHRPALVFMEWVDEDTLRIHMPNANRKIDSRDSFSVWLIRYQDHMIQRVEEGQTAGRVLRFSNIVRGAKHIAKWHGTMRTIEVDVEKPIDGPERGGYVTIIHQINGSEIMAAGKVPDYKPLEKTPDTKGAKGGAAGGGKPAPITGPLLE